MNIERNFSVNFGRWVAGGLLGGTLVFAIFINIEITQSMGWFLGFVGFIALTGEVSSSIFWNLNKLATSLVLVICLSTSATLELAFYRLELSMLTEAREAAGFKRDRLQREIKELTDQLWVNREKLPNEIQANINQLLSRRIRLGKNYTTVALATKDCSPKSRLTLRHCEKILKLRTQLAAALGIDELEKKRDKKQMEFDALESVGDSNALTRTIAELIRLRWEASDASVETFMQIFYVVFIHTMLMSTSWLCFRPRPFDNSTATNFSSVNILSRSEAQSPGLTLSLSKVPDGRDVAEHFLKTRLKASKKDFLDLKPTHDIYCVDCNSVGCTPVALNVFSRMLADLQLDTKKTRGSRTGGTRYWGVTITDGQ